MHQKPMLFHLLKKFCFYHRFSNFQFCAEKRQKLKRDRALHVDIQLLFKEDRPTVPENLG